MNTVQNALKDVLEDVDVYHSHGFLQWKRCVGTWVVYTDFQDYVVNTYIIQMFLQTVLLHTTR